MWLFYQVKLKSKDINVIWKFTVRILATFVTRCEDGSDFEAGFSDLKALKHHDIGPNDRMVEWDFLESDKEYGATLYQLEKC